MTDALWKTAIDAIRREAIGLLAPAGLDRVIDLIADAQIVLIGEATHGTLEFYRTRALLTERLIESHGFNVVAVEGDWPDTLRANRWAHGNGDDWTAEEALGDFTRFPRWMWRNREVVRFLEWLRAENRRREPRQQTGFYGLDLYSLHRSMEAVLAYLRVVDPSAAERARQRYACFDVFGADTQAYGYATTLGLEESCERAVVAQLVELQRKAAEYASRDGRIAIDDYFSAEQNAHVVHAAEAYYRAMFGRGAESWNLRDRHMMSTLLAVLDHVRRLNGRARAVVWAHNSHLGDARATEMGAHGELNLGQLVREQFGDASRSVGFSTHTGSVTAAINWDAPADLMAVRPSLHGSYERLFHETGLGTFALDLRGPVAETLRAPRLERAIGVVYRAESERRSHYFRASLPAQFDVAIHYDETRAVEPLERWSRHEVDLPETYPTGV